MHYPSRRALFALIGLSLLGTGRPAVADDSADLLAIVKERHRAAREAIRTFSADVAITITAPKKEPWVSGKYWRSGNTVRVQEFSPTNDSIQDSLLKDGEIRGFGRHRIGEDRFDRHGVARDFPTRRLGLCDVWAEMLIDLFDTSARRFDYDHFLLLAARPPGAVREKRNGVDCIRVSLTVASGGSEFLYTFWHDVARNCLIRGMTLGRAKEDWLSEWEIQEFREFAPGAFVPVSCRFRSFEGGQLKQEMVATLANVKVNEPIAEEVFTLPPVPYGIVLNDGIDGTHYPIDDKWRRIGPKVSGSPVDPRTRRDDPETEESDDTAEKPNPPLRWLPLGVAAVIIVTALWCYHRRQAGQKAPAGP